MLKQLTAFALIIFVQPCFAQITKVTESIYRGPRPDETAIATLAKMNVRVILDLEDNDEAIRSETAMAARYGVKVISTPMSGFWWPQDNQVQLSLSILEQNKNYPIFVHCQHGQDRTGLIVGLYRVFYQHWTPAAAWAEMEANGFHRILFLLKEYFEQKTGFEI